MFKPKFLIIHHTSVSYQDNPKQFDAVNQYHKEKWNVKSSLGFFGGYNYIMSKDGIIRQYRVEGEETIACVGYNFNALHICLEGNFDTEQPTTTQRHNLRLWIKEKMAKYDLKPEAVVAHRKFANKSCCGKNLTDAELFAMADWKNQEEQARQEEERKKAILEKQKSLLEKVIALLKEWLNKLKIK